MNITSDRQSKKNHSSQKLILQLSSRRAKAITVINHFLQKGTLVSVHVLHVCWLTFLRYDPQGDAQACILDQFHNVGVWHADDGLAVHRQDPVSHLQLPAAVSRAALDDAANFMGHSCR